MPRKLISSLHYKLSNINSAILGKTVYEKWAGNSWGYPIDLQGALDVPHRYFYPLDNFGIPMKRIGTSNVYVPTRVCAYGLANWNSYMRNRDTRARDIFIKTADWLIEFKDAIYYYNFDWIDMGSKWISAMAQGEAISVLVRAYRETGQSRYLDHALLSTAPLSEPVDSGGVVSVLPNGLRFLEEYPGSVMHPHVLNGFLYTMIGLCDLHKVNEAAAESSGLFEFANSLESSIGLWDKEWWSIYDLGHVAHGVSANYATYDYHKIHCIQLEFVARVLGLEEASRVGLAWERAASNPVRRLAALAGKVRYRIVR